MSDAGSDLPTPRTGHTPDMRASDAERDHAAEILRAGLTDGRLTVSEYEERVHSVYAARTRAELVPLVADVDAESVTRRASATRVPARANGTRWVVSVMSGTQRRGRWQVASECTVLDVMGGSELDLTQADLPPGGTTIRVVCVMGGSKIRVPQGARVHVSKFALMGGHDVRLDDAPPAENGPVIHLRLLSIMGGVSVRQGMSKKRRRQLNR